MRTNEKLFDFIADCPTAYHTTQTVLSRLAEAGYTRLTEDQPFRLEKGRGYVLSRGDASLIAFRVPECGSARGFMMTAAHGDSPSFKIKDNPEIRDGHYVRLSTEKYGGMLCAPFLDRPLSVAGRLAVETDSGIKTVPVDLKDPTLIIPSVAIHMNRQANEGATYNAAVDMQPLYAVEGEGTPLLSLVAEKAGVAAEKILAHDLYVYNPQKGCELGGMICAPRLDDLACVFASLEAFLTAGTGESIPVFCLFDNEEVGSATAHGAASTFLRDTLSGILCALDEEKRSLPQLLANSFLVSCDNAHAVHPNHGELSDKNHSVYLNGGIVIKYNANRKYTTDAVSAALFRRICKEAGVETAAYANRADMPGGSTLGSIASTVVFAHAIDIGLAQLAMHSAYETAGARDTDRMISALKLFFEKSLSVTKDGDYTLS